MKTTKRITLYLTGFLLALPLFSFIFTSQSALAYKCTGQTGDLQHYYKNGACYQPVGTTCLDNPAPANSADCKNRDTSKDTKVDGEVPVRNDGSQITEWQCASGTYNAKKQVCENCTAFGACQTLANVSPTPKGNDTTVDPTQNSNDNTTSGNSKTDDAGGKGECAGEKTDFFACGANGADAIVAVIKIIILIVSVGVGVVAVGGIVYGAILYASAQDNQEQVQKGVRMIRSVIIGLVLYIFMVSIINFLVPGGVFGGSETPAATSSGCSTNNTVASNSNNSNSASSSNSSTGNSNSSTATGTNASNNSATSNTNQNCATNNSNTNNSSTKNNKTGTTSTGTTSNQGTTGNTTQNQNTNTTQKQGNGFFGF